MLIESGEETIVYVERSPGVFEPRRFLDLVRLDLICFAAVLLLMLPFCLAHEVIYTWVPAWSILGGWALLLPLGVAVQFLPNLFTNWLIREKNFRASPYLGGGTNLGLRVFNLIYGLISKGAVHGLIVGEMVVRGVGLLAYWKAIGHGALVRVLTFPPWTRLRETLHEYRMHPLVLFPEFFELISSTNKRIIVYGDGARHENYNDIHRETVFLDLEKNLKGLVK